MASSMDTSTEPLVIDLTNDEEMGEDVIPDESKRVKVIEDLLKWAYATTMRPLIQTLIEEDCYGCQYDRPSQRDHETCLMTPYQDQITTYYHAALAKVDTNIVIGRWFGHLGKMNPKVAYHEISPYLNPEVRQAKWEEGEWDVTVREMLSIMNFNPV